jgi:hypothetical protein
MAVSSGQVFYTDCCPLGCPLRRARRGLAAGRRVRRPAPVPTLEAHGYEHEHGEAGPGGR